MDKKKLLQKALLELPLVKSDPNQINAYIESILLSAGFAGVNTLNRAKLCSKKQAEKELDNFVRKAIALHKQIDDLHRTSLIKFEKHDSMHPIYLQAVLEDMIKVADRDFDGDEFLESSKNRSSSVIQERQTTIHLAKVYSDLTGKIPTRKHDAYKNKECGEFPLFVQKVFDALGFKGSGISQASDFVKNMSGK